MINLRVTPGTGLYPRTIYTCYKCATIESFYSIPPSRCEGCRSPIPDICQIKDNIESRKAYHKTAAKHVESFQYLW